VVPLLVLVPFDISKTLPVVLSFTTLIVQQLDGAARRMSTQLPLQLAGQLNTHTHTRTKCVFNITHLMSIFHLTNDGNASGTPVAQCFWHPALPVTLLLF
jgi:hypothetical protein